MKGSAGGINTLLHPRGAAGAYRKVHPYVRTVRSQQKGRIGKGTLLCKGGEMEEGNEIQVSLNLSLEKLPWL